MESQPPSTPNKSDETPLLTPDEFRALVTQLERDTNRVRSIKREIFSIQSAINCLIFFWLSGHGAVTFGILVFVIVSNIIVEIHIGNWRRNKDVTTAERMLRFVENTQDVGLLGALLDLYGIAGRLKGMWHKIHTATHIAVMRLLPLLQCIHADVLNTHQRERLRRRLFRPQVLSGAGYWIGADYYFAVLSAMEQIGDKRDLPDVERLAKEYYITDEIRTAAERCAQIIRERIAREEGKDFLLRADRKPKAFETLLRPSVEHDDTPPQQLLRAATSEDGNSSA